MEKLFQLFLESIANVAGQKGMKKEKKEKTRGGFKMNRNDNLENKRFTQKSGQGDWIRIECKDCRGTGLAMNDRKCQSCNGVGSIKERERD